LDKTNNTYKVNDNRAIYASLRFAIRRMGCIPLFSPTVNKNR
jgi:hypothetical protein